MPLREVLIFLSMSTLVYAGWVYGYKFLREKNYLLGLEWIILGFSATNIMLWYAGFSDVSFEIMMFCDAFSRAVGIPIIGTVGVMKATHDFEPSVGADIAMFAAGGLFASIARFVPAAEPFLPYLYIGMAVIFILLLGWFGWILIRARVVGHGIALILCMIPIGVIALLDGIVPIPGEEKNLFFNFLFVSHLGWAIVFAEIYYAYGALVRARNVVAAAKIVPLPLAGH